MFDIFRKKYTKLPDGRLWTKNTLLKRMYDEMGVDFIEHDDKYNVWKVRQYSDLFITFETSNYPDKNELRLICSISFRKEGHISQFKDDLRDFGYQVHGRKGSYRPLSIRRDEVFEGSILQKDCTNIFLPFLLLLNDKSHLAEVITGGHVKVGENTLELHGVYTTDYFDTYPVN